MPNHGSIYQARTANQVVDNSISFGVISTFNGAYKKFWEKRGVDIGKDHIDIPTSKRLGDPYSEDYVRLRKAIEYGRSYRKDKKGES